MMYRLQRLMTRIALRLFYRRIEVEGSEQVPKYGPVLFVPNHVNALVDPLLVIDPMQRPVTLTAKSVLARHRVMAFLLKICGVITFHRQQDVVQVGPAPPEP